MGRAEQEAAHFLFIMQTWQNRSWRWSVAAGAFVLSLALMLGGRTWVRHQQQAPIVRAIEELDGVERAWVGTDGPNRALWVETSPVRDVGALIENLKRYAASGWLGPIREIVLVDSRDAELSAALADLSLPLQEGASSGAFTVMAERVSRKTQDLRVQESRLYVDDTAVYLLLVRDGRHLYAVVPRPAPAGGLLPEGSASITVRSASSDWARAGASGRGGEAR